MSKPAVTIIGAGLAGCEAAWQVTRHHIPVRLVDMKPAGKTPAHHMDTFAELVCSNSLKASRLQSASGLLKEEIRILGSLLMDAASRTALPAGGALAVDRDRFSRIVTDRIRSNPLIEIETKEIHDIPDSGVVIIATGPLTEGGLFEAIQDRLGSPALHFFDAAAPIVTIDSIDQQIAFRQSRYDRGGSDYLNCPMNQEEYERFVEALLKAEKADIKDFDREAVFEGCMPIETMAARGSDTIRFGPLKPVGLTDPRTGRRPYACVQLRQDNQTGDLYNLVGFQTRLKFAEQKRVFRMIPGLQHAEFVRYGVMHRNTYLNSPGLLNPDYSVISQPSLFFAGQMTGVEGYVESISSGLVAGNAAAWAVLGKGAGERLAMLPGSETMTGALANYIASPAVRHFQPMNANFGLLPPPVPEIRSKDAKQQALVDRSLESIRTVADAWSRLRGKTGP